MRLALINEFYPPDFAPTGKLAASLAQHRANLGDQVTIIAARGGYVPESPVQSSNRTPNLRVIRLWTPRLGKKTLLARIVDYGWFFVMVAVRMAILGRQDVVIAMTTPPFIGLAGALHKRLHRGTKLVLWNMDSYPEAPERAGVISPTKIVSRAMRGLNRRLDRELDHVVCLDNAMQRLLSGRYPQEDSKVPMSVINNWEPAAGFPADGTPPPSETAMSLGLEGRFVLLYMGNAGFGHRFETIIEATERLRDEPMSLLFVGGGERWNWLRRAKEERGLQNLHLHRYVPEPEARSMLAMADCALVTLRDSYLGVISPSKIHASLAMGLPLIYVGPEGGNVDEAIQRFKCGVSLRNGDVDGLVRFIRQMMAEPAYLNALKIRARKGYEAAYSDATALPKLDRLLEGLVEGTHPA